MDDALITVLRVEKSEKYGDNQDVGKNVWKWDSLTDIRHLVTSDG